MSKTFLAWPAHSGFPACPDMACCFDPETGEVKFSELREQGNSSPFSTWKQPGELTLLVVIQARESLVRCANGSVQARAMALNALDKAEEGYGILALQEIQGL